MIVVQHILLRDYILITPLESKHGTGKNWSSFARSVSSSSNQKNDSCLGSANFRIKIRRHLTVKPKTGGGWLHFKSSFFQRVIPSVSGVNWFALEQKMGLSISEKTCKTYSNVFILGNFSEFLETYVTKFVGDNIYFQGMLHQQKYQNNVTISCPMVFV